MTDRSIAEAQGQLGSLVQRYARLGVFSETSLEYSKYGDLDHFFNRKSDLKFEIWGFFVYIPGFLENFLVIHMDSGYIQLCKHLTFVACV